MKYTIVTANQYHAESIFSIGHFWLQKGNECVFEKGSIKHVLNFENIISLIKAKEIVVALSSEVVVGYYLTNSLFISEHIEKRKNIIENLINKRLLPKGKYVYQVQAAVIENALGKGLSTKMLEALKVIVADRFDYLAGIISEENYNSIIQQHRKAGWIILGKFEAIGYLAYMPVKGKENE